VASLADWQDDWAHTLHGVADSGKIVYLRSVTQFRDWLPHAYPKATTPRSSTPRHVHGWLAALVEPGRSDASRLVRLIAVRLWLGHCAADPPRATDGSRR